MDGVTGGWTDCWDDGRAGMMDGLAVGSTDSATDLRVDRQTVGAVGMTDRLVTRQADMLKDRQVVRQMYRRSGGERG